MKTGRSLHELAGEVAARAEQKRDYLINTNFLRFDTAEGRSQLLLPTQEPQMIPVSELAHRQIAERLNIPQKYYDRMREEEPRLLDANVNAWFLNKKEPRMLRILNSQVRAFLSDKYRRIDHEDLAEAVLPSLSSLPDAEVVSCEITETRMYIKVINHALQSEVALGDVIKAGIVITNSEVGLGSVKIEPLLYRLVCRNGLIVQDYAQRKYHVGRQVDVDTDFQVFSDETLQADDKAFFLKVRDTVRLIADETKFQLFTNRIKKAATETVEAEPDAAVELLSQRFQLNQNEKGSVLRHLILGGDLSAWGYVNAITRTAEDVEAYDRATELERMGGALLALPVNQWTKSVKKIA